MVKKYIRTGGEVGITPDPVNSCESTVTGRTTKKNNTLFVIFRVIVK